MLVDFHPKASEELTESAGWYAERSSTAARNFLVAVVVAIKSFVADPERLVHIDDRHQSCSVIRFPFQIVFRHEVEIILVIVIAQAKRRPGYWRNR